MIDLETEVNIYGLVPKSRRQIPLEAGCYIIATGPQLDWISRTPFGNHYLERGVVRQGNLSDLLALGVVRYIGAAKDLNQRFYRGHEAVRFIRATGVDDDSIMIGVVLCHESNRREVEIELMRLLNPTFNITGIYA